MGARISTGSDSKQNYRTPADFMGAVTRRFGPIIFDLAATADNTQSPRYFAPVTGPEGPLPLDLQAEAMDAFDHSWAAMSRKYAMDGHAGLLWLNPEFSAISTWATRCRNEVMLGANILLLVPAAVGSLWFRKLIAGFADVYLLTGRLSFIPGKPYNKDCLLAHYNPTTTSPAWLDAPIARTEAHKDRCATTMSLWDWKADRITHHYTENKDTVNT